MSLEHISYSLNRQGCFLASLLKAAEPSALAQRTELFSLTFSSVEKEAKRHPPNPSPSLYGRGVTDYGGKPPYVRVLVWLTEPVPLRGEPWSFYRLARGVSRDVSWLRWGEPWVFYRLARGVSQQMLRKVFPLVNSTDNIRSTYHFDDIGDMVFFQSANDCCRTLANIFRD